MIQKSLSFKQKLKNELDKSTNGAIFSEDRKYRYILWRSWKSSSRNFVLFIALNPSTADESADDPTIRRCKSFAMNLSADGFLIANLFAFRATRPIDLKQSKSPIGIDNDNWLVAANEFSQRTVVCWGNDGSHMDRAAAVLPRLINPEYLRMTKSGHPSHPLYLPGNLVPQVFPV